MAGVCGYKRIIRSQTSFLFVLPTGPFLTAEVCGRDLDCASDESSDESTTYKQWNRVKKHACLSVCSFVCPSSCMVIYPLAQIGEKKTFKKPTISFTHVANTTQKKWKQRIILSIPEMNFNMQGTCNTKNIFNKDIYYHKITSHSAPPASNFKFQKLSKFHFQISI